MLEFDSQVIQERLKKKPTKSELAALFMAFLFVPLLLWWQNQWGWSALFLDFRNYMGAAHGDIQNYFYACWGLPLLYPLSILPFQAALVIWLFINIAGVWFATRVFGSKSAAALFSYPLLLTLFFGQISGLLAAGVALSWWGMSKQNWLISGLGFLIAAIKPQVGIIALLLWAIVPLSWKQKIYSMVLPVITFILCFLFDSHWLINLWIRIHDFPPEPSGSISLWKWIGPWALLLFLPVLFLPLERNQRIIAFVTVWVIASPYYQMADLLTLFSFPLGWFPLLSWLAVVFAYPSPASPLVVSIVILLIYLYLLVSFMKRHFKGNVVS